MKALKLGLPPACAWRIGSRTRNINKKGRMPTNPRPSITRRQGAIGAPPQLKYGAIQGLSANRPATRTEASALPIEAAAAKMLSGCDKRCAGKTLAIIELAAGPSVASPMESSNLARQSVQKPIAKPLAIVIKLQPIRPAMISHLRLNWSAMRASGRPAKA